jgi:hypothetical protein
MHNGKRFNQAMQARDTACVSPRQQEDTMATLPDILRAEVARCHNLAQNYTLLGTAGAFASALLEESLRDAHQALRLNERQAIERALERLRAFRDVRPDLPVTRVAPPSRLRALPGTTHSLPRERHGSVPEAGWGRGGAVLQEQFFTWTRAA